jgi:hypothetical protein
VTSTMDNPRFNGTNGYFARRKGRLALPPLQFAKGISTQTWGDDNGDPVIDMVNSVRVTVDNAQEAGLVRIALLSTLRDDIPTLPDGHHFIGIWSFDGSDLGGFDGADLSIRYDDAMARTLGLNEDLLKMWEYDGLAQSWQRLDHGPDFIRDTFDRILTGHANGEMTYFAVSAPEPTSVTLLALASGAALLRRRRRRRAK